MTKIRVMVVDDQALMRDGLSTILSTQEDIDVIAQVENGEEALKILKNHVIDVVLMDIRMPIMDGVVCTKEIMSKGYQTKVIILTTFDDDDYIINALSYGASGYLLKEIDGASLINAVRDVMQGDLLLPSKIATKLAAKIGTIHQSPPKSSNELDNRRLSFTEREKDIIKYLVDGLTNRELSDQLHLTEGTIKNYLTGIYGKIGTSDRVKATLILQKMEL